MIGIQTRDWVKDVQVLCINEIIRVIRTYLRNKSEHKWEQSLNGNMNRKERMVGECIIRDTYIQLGKSRRKQERAQRHIAGVISKYLLNCEWAKNQFLLPKGGISRFGLARGWMGWEEKRSSNIWYIQMKCSSIKVW